VIPIATADEMRRADRRAIAELGVPGLVLMENAGRGAADLIERVFGPAPTHRIALVCGKGSNGGDGFVAARHLAGRGAEVAVWLIAAAGDVAGDAAANLEVLRRGGIAVTEVATAARIGELAGALARTTLVVDALLGTGARGPAQGLTAEAIGAINRAGRPVCALDLPSGLLADAAHVPGAAVQADLTVTFGLAKPALYLLPAAARAGRVEIADLGVPTAWLAAGVTLGLTERADVRRILPPRALDAHKGRHGHLLVVAGSAGKTGAAVLACRGALRAGTGLVTCAVPASQQPVVAAQIAEAMTEPVAETAASTLSAKALDRLAELTRRMDAVAIGPGVGLDQETQAAVRDLVRTAERPMVVDADALTALAGHLALLREAPAPRLITPHPGEAARLLGSTAAEVQADRLASARALAEATGAMVALKGAGTVVAGPDGTVRVNPTGNPGLATGGTGDVLTGVAGGLLAQGIEPAAALVAAVYVHGLAGDVAARERGATGLLAGDVAEALPAALRAVSQESAA
jgi:NAD(P)H-hydrate epimerase